MDKQDFVKGIYSSKYINKVSKKVKSLGIDNKLNVYDLIIGRLVSSIAVFVISLFIFRHGYIVGPVLTLIYYFLFNKVMLDDKIKKRSQKLESEAMHFFEVLTLSLETGRNLAEAIEVTTANVDGSLSKEFKEVAREISFGKSLNESLQDMQERIPSDTINNIILSLTESNIYGNSIIVNLYNQVDFLREKRKMEIKGKISKVPVLISVVSVFFFIPLLLLMILGPILLDYIS